VQETWLMAVRRVRTFDPERARFSTWLRGIATNVLRNQFRRTRSKQPLQGLDGLDKEAAVAGPEPREVAERIGRALSRLHDRYEAVLQAKYLDQQSVEQIARAWQETPKAIESLLARARQAFREAYLQED
jgi:RNA polymerase sigma-70 factor (ECF subfamily)